MSDEAAAKDAETVTVDNSNTVTVIKDMTALLGTFDLIHFSSPGSYLECIQHKRSTKSVDLRVPCNLVEWVINVRRREKRDSADP